MDVPSICSVCRRPLRQIKHLTAHHGQVSWDAHVRTCPHNLSEYGFEEPRHDEWHQGERGWVKRET